jgi:hypothetical protein
MILLLTAVAAACLSDPVELLAAHWRATQSTTQLPATIVSVYSVKDSGLIGRETSVTDIQSGYFSYSSAVGPISGGGGFDGKVAWSRDLTGFFSPQTGGNKLQLAVNQAYRNANLWWRADRGGSQIESIGCDRLRFLPPGGAVFEAAFDPQTHLLQSVQEDSTFGNRVEIHFSSYVRRHGSMVPTHVESITNEDHASLVTKTLLSQKVTEPRPAASYAMPMRQPIDWAIAPGGRVTMPFQLINNHIIIDVKVDGHGPLPFLLDTGGHEILTPSTVAQRKLQVSGSSPSGGAGEQTSSSGFMRIGSLDAGGAVLRNPSVVVTDFSPLQVEGLQVGGMLGVGFMERFVVQIDYGAKTVTVIDPARFDADDQRQAGTPVNFQFYEHMPQVAGEIEGHVARFLIDTGSRSDVSLTSPFVKREGLDAANAHAAIVTDGWGAGGPTRSKLVRARSMSLGTVQIGNPLAGLSAAKRGTFSDANFDGNVGSGLLKRFRVTFDYRQRTMYLSPLFPVDAGASHADRAGMWINLGSNGLEVMDTLTGGPADTAGLRKGDIVTFVADDSVSSRSLSDWRNYWKIAPLGQSITIRYKRDGAELVTKLIPAELVPDQ